MGRLLDVGAQDDGDGEHNPRFGLLSINLQKRKAVAMLPPVVFTVSGPRDCEHLWKLDVRAGFGLVTAPNARANTGGCIWSFAKDVSTKNDPQLGGRTEEAICIESMARAVLMARNTHPINKELIKGAKRVRKDMFPHG